MSDYCTQCGSAELHSRCDRDSPSASPDRLGLSYAWGVGEIVRSVPARYLCVKRRREAAAIANNAEPNRMMLDDSGSDDTGMSPGTGTGFDPGALVLHGEPPWPLSEPLPNPKTG